MNKWGSRALRKVKDQPFTAGTCPLVVAYFVWFFTAASHAWWWFIPGLAVGLIFMSAQVLDFRRLRRRTQTQLPRERSTT